MRSLTTISIRHKLLAALLLIGVSAVVVTGYLGYKAGEQGLTQTAMNQLTGIRRSKAFQIESYFRNIRSQVRTLKSSRLTIDAIRDFKAEFLKLDDAVVAPAMRSSIEEFYRLQYLPRLHKLVPSRARFEDYLPHGSAAYDLQAAFISNNPFPVGRKHSLDVAKGLPGYSAAHAKYHPSFRKLAEEFGYYDLFLVDTASGRVVYTIKKEVDFATSLYSGPYQNSGLAKVVAEARQTQDTSNVPLTDFEMYEPSYGAPAAFAAAAIYDGLALLGVLVIQLPNDEIDRVVSGDRGWERDGLGRSGDSGVVGPDYRLRSNARGFMQRQEEALAQMRVRGVPAATIERIRAYNSTVLQQEVRLPSVTAALNGEEGTRVQVGSAGRRTLVSYMPLTIPGLHWTIASRIDLAEALEPVDRLRKALLWLGLFTLLLTGVVALLLTQTILGPVNRLVAAARRVASSDFSVQVPIRTNDELGLLSRTFNEMVCSIREKTEIIEQKNRENEQLLLNILPGPIAERLKAGETKIADSFADVTVLFADIVGFTSLSAKATPRETVDMLNDLFTRFDEAAQRCGVEKIKTIGDAYMAVAGLPTPDPEHARRMVMLALRMLEEVQNFSHESGGQISVRIGINSGPVCAGVVGSTKFIYDLWGDTVNLASRMESHGLPGMIHVTRPVYERLAHEFEFAGRGFIEVKGKGSLETWFLTSPSYAEQHS